MMPAKPAGLARAYRALPCLVFIAALGACTGDFGRHQPSFFGDRIMPATRTVIREIRGVGASEYPFSADEAELRARSETLIHHDREPSPNRLFARLSRALGLPDTRHETRRRLEHNTGTTVHEHRSSSRRPDTIALAVRSTVRQVGEFGRIALRVYRADERRHYALVGGGPRPAADIHDVTARIADNRRIVLRTLVAVRNRIDELTLELRKAVLEHPDVPPYRARAEIARLARVTDDVELHLRGQTFPPDPVGPDHVGPDHVGHVKGMPPEPPPPPLLLGG